MGTGVDFLNWLDLDTSIKILMCLEDPSDLVRMISVSRMWRHFVIANGLCKLLCLRMFPQLSRIDHVTEPNCTAKRHAEVGSSNFMEWETLEREHRVYAFLARGCMSFALRDCILKAIVASSTDNYPEESIDNTLEPREVSRRASYWSSKGQSNPAVPETLTYKLVADLCVITEINIRPFQAYFQWGLPIYSAKSVRFRLGHVKSSADSLMDDDSCSLMDDDSCSDPANNKFVWTYTSQEFPMAQENRVQNFKLPEPVLCVGGILQIELLGRVQRQQMDGLFYICVSYVQVVGRPLSHAFGVEILEPSEKFVIKALSYTQPDFIEESNQIDQMSTSESQRRYLEQIVNLMRGHMVDVVEYEWDEEEDEDDDEDDDDDDDAGDGESDEELVI